MSNLEMKVYDLLKARFNEEEAKTVIEYIDQKTEDKMQQKKDVFLTKDDKVDLMRVIHDGKVDTMRAIYATNLIQFLATIGSIIAIFHFMMK